MTSSWWLVLRILLKMLVSSYLRLFVASTSVSALTCWQIN
uniref:Eukaryotic translation initiation factor 3 subunit E n=1 Tax=Molossus molossus TaxID=27622 RepID=A0A7J8DTM9_MOLMO|nr:eukaryotic translation initiation factor 3 subunit E [Molossus molossus]